MDYLRNVRIMINTKYYGREADLFATISNVISNVRETEIFICFATEKPVDLGIFTGFKIIAETNDVKLHFIHTGSINKSLPAIKADFFEHISEHVSPKAYILHLDDDVFVEPSAFKLIAEATRLFAFPDYYALSFVDTTDIRKYTDWNLNYYVAEKYMIEHFIKKFGYEKIPCHLWEGEGIKAIPYKIGSAVYLFKAEKGFTPEVYSFLRSFEKGERGYDACMPQFFSNPHFLFGANVWHNATEPLMNKEWFTESVRTKNYIEKIKAEQNEKNIS